MDRNWRWIAVGYGYGDEYGDEYVYVCVYVYGQKFGQKLDMNIDKYMDGGWHMDICRVWQMFGWKLGYK